MFNAWKNSTGMHANCYCISLKNKNGDISDAGSYGFVFLATTGSKLFEHQILSCISSFVTTAEQLVSSQNIAFA